MGGAGWWVDVITPDGSIRLAFQECRDSSRCAVGAEVAGSVLSGSMADLTCS